MKILEVGFMRLHPDAILPHKAHEDDSGFDLYALEDVTILAGETKQVRTGIAVKLPAQHEGHVRPKSGITSKTDARVQFGTVDNGYRGEVEVTVDNKKPVFYRQGFSAAASVTGNDRMQLAQVKEPIHIKKGQKIAQLVVAPLPTVVGKEIFEMDETERGANGFGSTGV